MPRFIDVDQTLSDAAGFDARRSIGVAGTRVVGGTGIDLTGATASDTAFQAILDAAEAAAAAGEGTVEVYIPPGILSLTTKPTIGAGIKLKGAGIGATTITGSNTQGVLNLDGASDITISDLTVESTASGTSAIGIESSYNGLQSRVTITRCRIAGATNNAVRFPYAVKDLTFSDNIVEDCTQGFTHYAPTVASGLTSTGIRISRNRFSNVGSVNIQIYGGTNALTVSTVVGVEISGNDLRDFAQTGANGPIPIEPTCVTNIRISGNTVEGPSTRGISTGSNVNMTISGNTIKSQSIYAIELNGGRQISIVGNVAENCRVFAQQTNDPAITVDLADVVIANNTYTGSGLASAATTSAIFILTGRRVRITGNVFTNWQYLRDAVRIGNGSSAVAQDCVVEGNTFIVSDANTPITTITVRTALRTNVARNTVRINRNLVAGDDALCVITAVEDAATDDTLIDGNYVQFSGTIAAATSSSAIGNGAVGAAACPGLTVCRNHVINGPKGLRIVTNSADLTVYDNETSTCSDDDIPATALTAKSVPASATARGIKGQWSLDSSYIYVCTATDTWKRVAIATWP